MPKLSTLIHRQSRPFRAGRVVPTQHRRRSKSLAPNLHIRAWVCLLVSWLLIAVPAFGSPLDGFGPSALEQAAVGLWEAIGSWVDGLLGVLAEVPETGETHDMGFEIEPNG